MQFAVHDAVRADDVKGLEGLLAVADPDLRDMEGRTALHIAAELGYEGCVRTLLAHDAMPAMKNREGSNPLHLAAQRGHSTVVQLLCTAGISVNTTDANSKTPLCMAAHLPNSDTVEVLLNANADVHIYNSLGYSPAHEAIMGKATTTLRRLLEYGHCANAGGEAVSPLLHHAVGLGSVEAVEMLLLYGADIEGVGVNEDTPLFCAVRSLECVTVLLRRGARVRKPGEGYRLSPLGAAAKCGNTEVVEALLAAGAQVSATEVRCAIRARSPASLTALLQSGAAHHARDMLHTAIDADCAASLQILISHQADLEFQEDDLTPYQHASVPFLKKAHLAEILREAGCFVCDDS